MKYEEIDMDQVMRQLKNSKPVFSDRSASGPSIMEIGPAQYGRNVFIYPVKNNYYTNGDGIEQRVSVADYDREPQVGELVGIFTMNVKEVSKFRDECGGIKYKFSDEEDLFYHLLVGDEKLSVRAIFCTFKDEVGPIRAFNVYDEGSIENAFANISGNIEWDIQNKASIADYRISEKLNKLCKKYEAIDWREYYEDIWGKLVKVYGYFDVFGPVRLRPEDVKNFSGITKYGNPTGQNRFVKPLNCPD